ncbi:MAG: DUF2306 domain-containing protein [Psychroflexus sp.]|nr:DUF2306 domain-containing protein [Psychroflexus sp.]
MIKTKYWFPLFALSAILIGLYPLLYFIIDRNFGLLQTKDISVLQSISWNIGFYTHIILGGLALLIGWSQFVEKWRKANPKFHHQIGKLYIAFVILSSLSGIYIGYYATGGFIASLGFISLGIIWFIKTLFAFLYVRKGNYQMHKKLMIYSYSACFAGVTLRIWLPLLTLIFEDFFSAYKIVAWLCWVPNLIIAYLINKNGGSS